MIRCMSMLVLIVMLVFSALATPAMAQKESNGNLRRETIKLMMQYGKRLYERRNYEEAEAVFNRVLTYDPNHAKAQRYLTLINPAKYKDTLPIQTIIIPSPEPIVVEAKEMSEEEMQAMIEAKDKEVNHLSEKAKSRSQTPVVLPKTGESSSLEAISQDINQLRQEINALKADMQS